ncbi:MAG: MerR family DNA-binding transcriptional regulator [Actinomycetota bacterium]|nr:MAG: MerR family DNA-binding transcriptional regulator [Actinomycetota bacterium]
MPTGRRDEPRVSTVDRAGGLLGIGEVLAVLQEEFADVSISKIRFLEAEGLIEPARTPSGYRKFSPGDVDRLRYVLRMQQERYLPLKVIRDQLDAMDRGQTPAELAGPSGRADGSLADVDGLPRADDFRVTAASRTRLTREQLLASSGLAEDVLAQLESYGLLAAGSGGQFDADALSVANTVAAMTGFGFEPRHLRSFRLAAEREAGLVEQVVSPLLRSRTAEQRSRADEVARELAALSVRLHAALVRVALRRELTS